MSRYRFPRTEAGWKAHQKIVSNLTRTLRRLIGPGKTYTGRGTVVMSFDTTKAARTAALAKIAKRFGPPEGGDLDAAGTVTFWIHDIRVAVRSWGRGYKNQVWFSYMGRDR